MNPLLLKTLISLAASNNKPAPGGTVGSDAQLKNRAVLFSDEATDLPEWGISGLPAMVLGAAPQTCLFVGDLTANAPDGDNPPAEPAGDEMPDHAPRGETVSFSLTIKSPPEEGSSLAARTIVWKLTVPVVGYRDVQTTANSPSVRAPVIKTQIKLGGVKRDVEIGLLEMSGLDQPLLIGKDTLGDKFLIRPDRPEDAKPPKAPSVDLTPKPQDGGADTNTPIKSDPSTPSETDNSNTPPTPPQTPATDATDQDASTPKTEPPTVPDSNAESDDSTDTGKAGNEIKPDDTGATSSTDTTPSNNDDTSAPAASATDTDTASTAQTEVANTVNTPETDSTDSTASTAPSATPDAATGTTTAAPNSAPQTDTANNKPAEDPKPATTAPAQPTETTPAQ